MLQFLFYCDYICNIYRPKCSCGKVMFLHLSVILFMEVCMPQSMLEYTPRGQTPPSVKIHPSGKTHPPGRYPYHLARHPPGQTPTPPGQTSLQADTPWAGTPWADTPPGRHPLGRHPPPAQCMLGYTWLLLRTVHILLECILVCNENVFLLIFFLSCKIKFLN